MKYGLADIQYRTMGEQLADLLTKTLSNEAFFALMYMLFGWGYG